MQFATGVGLGVLVAVLAYVLGALTLAGTIAAALIGGITFGAGGLQSAIPLLTFFISSSALSRFKRARKRTLVSEIGKGERRDHIQVLANGGVAGICALGLGLTGLELWFLGLAGALAAVNADTWSTELGVLAKTPPRLILGGAKVQTGTSGGITLQGTLAALTGALLIGMVAALVWWDWRILLPVILGGFLGALVDSVLGASVQAQFYCSHCEKVTERHPVHSCGGQTSLVRGWHWLNNDGVNFIASVSGAIAAGIVWLIMRGSWA